MLRSGTSYLRIRTIISVAGQATAAIKPDKTVYLSASWAAIDTANENR